MLGPTLEGLLLGGGTPGTTPPLTLDLALAQLTRPYPGCHPRDKGAHDRFASSVCSGGTPEGQLRWRSVARRSQDGDGEQTLAGGARRSSPAAKRNRPVSNWTRERLAEERRLLPYPWLLYSVYRLRSNPNVIPPRLRVWPINAWSARVRKGLNLAFNPLFSISSVPCTLAHPFTSV